jgi:two-component system, OmpR family, sensor kinase
LFGAGVVALAFVVFGVLLYALLSRGVTTNQDDALRSRAQEAVRSLQNDDLTPRGLIAPVDVRTSNDVWVEVFNSNGVLVYSTGQLNGVAPRPSNRMMVSAPEVFGGYFDTDGGFRYFGLQFDRGFVVTGQSFRVPQSNLNGVVVFLVISAIPTLIAALLASWLVAGRALAPLHAVAVAAEDIGRKRDFGRRLPVPASRDQVALFATSFNGMLDDLQDAFESQRRFVADASHELRTPLTTIQGNAGLLALRTVNDDTRRAAAADVLDESGRMARLVDRLLTLARADSGLRLALAPVDLRAITVEVTRQASTARPSQKLTIEAEPASVSGDEDALRQLLWILLDNACRYARTTIAVRLFTEEGWARLMVTDDGPGIPVDLRERVFERFSRADPSRAGAHAGLGLSIARWIVDQHRGRIVAGEALIGGAGFLVDLPLLPSS